MARPPSRRNVAAERRASLAASSPAPAPRPPPLDIGTIPRRDLLYRYRAMAGHNTLWLQVHASRGCPHDCDYCAVVRHFGRRVRTRPPENVVEDIRQSIAFHRRFFPPRLSAVLWLTDDNFFADRAWALSVLRAIAASGIGVRGLFIVGARGHRPGVGRDIARFVVEHGITGILVQAMYFVPGTPVYDQYRDRLLHRDWGKYQGHVVHFPDLMPPSRLQREIIEASARVYSPKRLLAALLTRHGLARLLFVGEFFGR